MRAFWAREKGGSRPDAKPSRRPRALQGSRWLCGTNGMSALVIGGGSTASSLCTPNRLTRKTGDLSPGLPAHGTQTKRVFTAGFFSHAKALQHVVTADTDYNPSPRARLRASANSTNNGDTAT